MATNNERSNYDSMEGEDPPHCFGLIPHNGDHQRFLIFQTTASSTTHCIVTLVNRKHKIPKDLIHYEAAPRLWAASGGLEVSNLIHIQGLHFSLINQQIIDNEQVSSLPVCTKYHQKTNGPIVIRYFDAGFWSGSDLLKEEFERRDKRQCWAAQQLNSS